jgi:predicted metal-dependent HD superfamily phosphohydrolase
VSDKEVPFEPELSPRAVFESKLARSMSEARRLVAQQTPLKARALQERWEELGRTLNASEALWSGLFREVVAHYLSAPRAYHTLQHIAECLAWLDLARDRSEEPTEVELAIWLHDVIYDPTANDSEQRSAQFALKRLGEAGVQRNVASRVAWLIEGTAHLKAAAGSDDATPSGSRRDMALLRDIDLAILGALPERFNEYDRQVRVEYSHVPDEVYIAARRRVIEMFLSKEDLFETELFKELLLKKAHDNLEMWLEIHAG